MPFILEKRSRIAVETKGKATNRSKERIKSFVRSLYDTRRACAFDSFKAKVCGEKAFLNMKRVRCDREMSQQAHYYGCKQNRDKHAEQYLNADLVFHCNLSISKRVPFPVIKKEA